ncbi:hypothetical protein APSETT444_009773 [Aspergillus pseudonomiae]
MPSEAIHNIVTLVPQDGKLTDVRKTLIHPGEALAPVSSPVHSPLTNSQLIQAFNKLSQYVQIHEPETLLYYAVQPKGKDQLVIVENVPGVKFAFTGDKLAVSFGENTSKNVLVAYRIGGLDWEFSNVTANSAYQFVKPGSSALDETEYADDKTFEMRVQIDGVSVASDARLASGQYATYEGLASWGFNFAAGLGNAEYTITTYQWSHASDVGDRANAAFGDKPESWNFTAHRAADLVIINLGTNDGRAKNNIPSDNYYQSYVKMVEEVHSVWPDAHIVLMSLWGNFVKSSSTWVQKPIYESEVQKVYQHFEKDGYVHYFDTKGILQHNDISPGGHPTDVGHLKVASHLMQWTKIKLGWEFGATGPEVQHDTTYWNNQESYKRSVFSGLFI